MLITPAYGNCGTCGNKTEIVENHCYVCHRLLAKERNVGIGGVILTVIGLIVIGLMSFFIIYIKQSYAKNKLNLPINDLYNILSIFYFVLGYGVSALIAGLWHAITGNVNKILLYAMSGTGIVLFIGARIIFIAK